jgi:hypothetical protein
MYPQQSPPPAQLSPDSAQQRTPKLTPRRHESAPQHSVSVVQLPCTIEHEHALAPKLHDAQLPSSGPAALPLAQLDVLSHQPQPLDAVHVPQLVDAAQGSGIGHELPSQLHAAHDPVSGPDALPFQHVPVSAHQPQSSSDVHPPQSVCAAQSLAVHSLESQLQSPHDPLLGPLEVPLVHAPEAPHHPQPARPVQSPQSPASAHGSVVPPHSLESQLQSPHDPPLGPPDVPLSHVPVSPHQPHG